MKWGFRILLDEQMEGVDHLSHERNKAQFDVNDMKIVWAGSREAFEVSDRMARLVANDPVSNFCSTVLIFRHSINFSFI